MGLYAHLGQVWEEACALRQPVALVLVSLDRFPTLHALHGEALAEQTLQRIADTLDALTRRPLDRAFSLGGGDFVVIWPDTADEVAAQLTRHLICLVRRQHLTVSLGVAISWPHRSEAIGEALVRAEDALRQAQVAGCNRTRWARTG